MRIRAIVTWPCYPICVVLLACCGCSDGKVIVRGTVTVDGQPIDEGMISLEPADGQGPTTGGIIKEGKYELNGKAAVAPLGFAGPPYVSRPRTRRAAEV